jgi:septum formation protein
MKKVILASGSAYRRELLSRILTDFDVLVPGIDEDAIKNSGQSPLRVACTLASMKADAVARLHPQDIVIGSDQLVDLDGTILGKPGTAEQCCHQLQAMSGRIHRLITAVCVVTADDRYEFAELIEMRMRKLQPAEIQRYVDRDAPLDCAGSYRIESAGIALFDAIRTTDSTAIIGLPLLRLSAVLRNLGVAIP